MNTLLLCLQGPMQSWGVQSLHTTRDTGLEPSKSGVIGLLCAALGLPRDDDASLERLAALRMGVRVDREGILRMDYHTAQQVRTSTGGVKPTELSWRYYLADAAFLVGLEGDDLTLLEQIQLALHHPVWPLYLGRKAFVPGRPVILTDGLCGGQALVESLRDYPLIARLRPQVNRLRVVVEDWEGEDARMDQPLSFARRAFAVRWVRTQYFPVLQPETQEAA